MIYATLTKTNLPCAYGYFRDKVVPPYLVYIGRGQTTLGADDTWYYRDNQYQVEYYFIKKDEAKEKLIEDTLLADGYNYDKSEDIYMETEGLFVIYYYI